MTEIHAAVPSGLAKDVSEAQTRGDENEAEPTEKEPKLETRGKGKERVKYTPPAFSKAQRAPLIEDEENIRHCGHTAQSESDESDWIPTSARSCEQARVPKQEEDVLGIRGPNPSVSSGDASKRILPVDSQTGGLSPRNTDMFARAAPGRTTHPQTSFIIPISPNIATSQQPESGSPESLRHTHENPSSVIQQDSQQHPLLKELSYTWRDSAAQHKNSILVETGEIRDARLKRLAGADFERKRTWELKRFKKAGCDLKRYNRGDFGPRTGVGRL
ncbi:hypothetical protein OPT61_g9454 [Boeremia exigua]|uniref:Uncharacterized protein n=1 Tax=Boeremia exigua TaxID=749465 RepID=A0ACC2HUV7_9PLEO|nr:hypothetical protein OPT61_g9454 [Boeremia exigua]